MSTAQLSPVEITGLKLEFIGGCESSEFRSYGRTEVLLSPSAPKEGDF